MSCTKDFYINKFSEEIDLQPVGNIKECFVLINYELQNLRQYVVSVYGHSYRPIPDPEKLVWTESLKAFITFFEPLIDNECIQYKGIKDKYAIYTNLLNHIYLNKQPDITVEYLMKVLKIHLSTPLAMTEKCKLTWNGTRDEFAQVFKTTICSPLPEKGKFLYHGSASHRAIAKKLHEVFQIENKKHPGIYISERSLIQAFKG